MIDKALVALKNELTSFLITKGDNAASVIVDNIGLSETTDGISLTNNIVITLVNIEEESTLKNQSPIRRSPQGTIIYENTPIYINLYVLITCNYFGDSYLLALSRLSLVIQFMQSKSSFSSSNTATGTVADVENAINFTMELFTLTFEQINHLWGSLGGRQVPFVVYKLRLVMISDHAVVRQAPLIEEVVTNVSSTNYNR